jgi:Bacterial Ig-like domain (group 2)/Regulator of chromosome condensation (RCC1) repeat
MREFIHRGIALAVLFSLSCTTTPTEPTGSVHDIDLVPNEATILVGDTIRLSAIPVDPEGNPLPGVSVEWSTDDTAVATVDSAGLLYGVSDGNATLHAKAGGVTRDLISTVIQFEGTGWTYLDVGCGYWNASETRCWPLSDGPVALPAPPLAPTLSVVRFGMYHFCGLARDGLAYCWGENDFGELGDGTTIDRSVPVPVSGGIAFDSIALGAVHTCGLTVNRVVYCWGADERGQLGIGGATDTCGHIRCSMVPRRVDGEYKAIAAGGTDRVGQFSNGVGITCGLSVESMVFCWGYNELGGIGDGSYTDRNSPTPVHGSKTAVAVAVGSSHACLLEPSGEADCWGSNGYGQLGLTLPSTAEFFCRQGDLESACTNSPQRIVTEQRFRSLVASDDVTCGLSAFGAAFCWGENGFGQTGIGEFTRGVAAPVRTVGSRTYLTIRAGLSTVCGLTPRHKGFCWGNGVAQPLELPSPG